MGDVYTNPPQSRNEAILRATIDGVEYEAPPQSRIEDLLLQLKAAIEGGGGGGTTVIANPSGEATADLEKLQVGTIIYDVEGNEVIANPSGTSSTDLTKLSVDGTIYGIPQGGTITVDDEMSNSSTNPVQNKVITSALAGKVDAVAGYGLSENDYTDTDAAKVAALGTAASKDSTNAVTEDSTDLVESGAVYTALATKQDTISDLSAIRSGASAGATALQPSETHGLVMNDGTIATMANAPIQGSSNPITSGGLYNEEKGIFNVMGITGALNYLKIEAVTTEVHGVTFTVNANKTITGNGLATEDIDFPIASQAQLQNIISTKGLLKLVGCPASGSLNSYYLYFVDDRTNETIDHGEGATIAWEGVTTTPLYIHVESGTQLNNVLFGPMVVDRNVISDYVKGVATNEDLEAALDGILNGTTLDSFGDVESALALKANTSDVPTVSVSHTGTASSTGVRKQIISVDSVNYDVDGSAYMEQSVTLSTSAATTVTFTNAIIADGKMLTFASSIWDLVPDSMTTAVGSCTITLPKWTSAETIGVRLYVR